LATEIIEVRWQGLVTAERNPAWEALVYDLNPWDRRALAIVRRLTDVAPSAPILLYVPHTPGVGALLEDCAGDPRVFVKLQFNDGTEIERLKAELVRIGRQIPCEQLAMLLRCALPEAPARVRDFLWGSLQALAHPTGQNHPTAHSVAAGLGLSVRTLERALAACGLPQPKELLNWLTLLYITLTAERTARSTAATGRAMGWRPTDIYRLRHRLLHRVGGEPLNGMSRAQAGEFDLAFLALIKRCGVPESRVQGLLDRAG
jgi:hypothetical protein